MSGTRAWAEIFAERMALVLAIGEANAVRQRAQAALGGSQIDRLTAERAGEAPGSGEAEAEAQLARAEARVMELEARLAALDRELEQAGP